jgi:hypothetical protein
VSQLAQIMRNLHSWQPPAPVLARYAAAECAPSGTDPGRHRDGRVVALRDFDWSRRGPRDIEVTRPAFSGQGM